MNKILSFRIFESSNNQNHLKELIEDLFLDMVDDGTTSVDTEYISGDDNSNNISICLNFNELEDCDTLESYRNELKDRTKLLDIFYEKYLKLKKIPDYNILFRQDDNFIEIVVESKPIIGEFYSITNDSEGNNIIRIYRDKLSDILFKDLEGAVTNISFNTSRNTYFWNIVLKIFSYDDINIIRERLIDLKINGNNVVDMSERPTIDSNRDRAYIIRCKVHPIGRFIL